MGATIIVIAALIGIHALADSKASQRLPCGSWERSRIDGIQLESYDSKRRSCASWKRSWCDMQQVELEDLARIYS